MEENNRNNSKNKPVIILLSVLIAAVLGVGGYIVIRDISRGGKDDNSSQNQNNDSQNSQSQDGGDSSQSQDSGDSGQSQDSGSSSQPQDNPGDQGGSTPSGGSDQPASTDIDASITYAEVRKNDFYIEAQTNGVISGTCEMSLLPANGGQGHHETVNLVAGDNVSVCSQSFSLKGMNPGDYNLTIVISSSDGRTKTLAKAIKV